MCEEWAKAMGGRLDQRVLLVGCACALTGRLDAPPAANPIRNPSALLACLKSYLFVIFEELILQESVPP